MTRRRPETSPAPRTRTALLAAVTLLLVIGPTTSRDARAAAARGTITEVRVVGNGTIAEDNIRRLIQSRPDRPFDSALANADVKRLMDKGWFSDVQAEVVEDPERRDGIILVFKVVEMPVVQAVEYRGRSKLRLRDLESATGLKPGSRADHVRNMLGVNQIRRVYEEKGYAMAEVRLLEGGKAGDTRVIFEIFEGPKCKITSVAFVGNELVSDATLKTKVRTKPFFGFGGLYRRDDIEEDARTLRQYYMGMGYFEVKVSYAIKPSSNLGERVVEYAIWEGVQYKVRDISFEGNEQIATDTLGQGLMLHSGQPFRQETFEADVKRIEEKYGEIGCIDAMVDVDRKFADPEKQPGVVDLVYKIQEGEPYTLGRFMVQGNRTTRDAVVRREAELAGLVPGEPLNLKRVELYRKRLSNLGYFVADPGQGKPIDIRLINRRSADRPYGELRNLDMGEVIQARMQDPGPEPLGLDPLGPVPGFDDEPAFPDSPPAPDAAPGLEIPPPEFDLVPPGPAPELLPAPAAPMVAPGPGLDEEIPFGAGDLFAPPIDQPLPPIAVPMAPGVGGAFGVPADGGRPMGPPLGEGEPPGLFPSMPGANMTDVGPDRNDPFPQRSFADIVTQVEEQPTGRLMLGVGANSYQGLTGSFILHERNFDIMAIPRSWREVTNGQAFRGAGQDFRIELTPGTLINRALVSFRDPYLFNLPAGYAIGFGASGYVFNRQYPGTFSESRGGGRFSLGSQVGTSTYVDVAARVENVRLYDFYLPAPAEYLAAEGNTFLTTIRPSLRFDNRNDPFAPNKGQYLEAAFEQGWGDFTFPKLTLEGRQYFTLGSRPDGTGKRILTMRGFAGFTGQDTPVYEQFFAGDFRTMRGFSYRGVGPFELGRNTGGIMSLIGSVEYQFPWLANDKLQQVIFSDFGTVEDEFAINDFRVTIGTGLRVYLPQQMFGPLPLAFDLAYPIVKGPDDREQMFTFFIGAFW